VSSQFRLDRIGKTMTLLGKTALRGALPTDGARGIDTDLIRPREGAVQGWPAERENNDFRFFHATHSSSGEG
jgi:hypothetical protein